VSTPGTVTGTARPDTRARWRGLAVLVAGAFVVDAVYALSRHAQYLTGGFDLGLFDQAVRAYSRFGPPVAPIKGVGYDLLGDHFHPVLAVLAPLYWVWDDPRVLLLAQAALFAVSVVPVARFTERRFGRRRALVVAAAYAFSWPLQAAVDFDVHEIAFAVPLLAFLVDAMDRRDLRWVVGSALALLLVREDMGAVVAVAGVLVAVDAWRARRRRGPGDGGGSRGLWVGLGLVPVGLVGFWFATAVAIPARAPSGTFAYWTYTALGPDPVSALRFALTHPWDVARLAVTPSVKAETLVMLFLPVLFAALGSRYVLLAAPLLAERFLNDREHLWTTEFHYSSVTAPIVLLAAVDVVGRLAARRTAGPDGAAARSTPGRRRLVDAWVAWTLAVVLVGTATDGALYPFHRLLTGEAFTRLEKVDHIEAVLTRLPVQVCVEADERITPHLTRDRFVTLPTRSQGLATWLVLDMDQAETGWQTPPPAVVLAAAPGLGFREVTRSGPIVLLERQAPVDPACRV